MASYSPVFSQGFIYYTDATPNVQFEVPSGFTAVLRDFTLYQSAGATYASVFTQNSEAAPSITVAFLAAVGAGNYDQWVGRIVVPAGGLINLYVNVVGAGAQCYVGGYLLRNSLS